ncbi:hypothetical protein OUZ56_021210 [Daphnia magna]|uniref:Uncharacterized protein n=1 Tax=Daphnia magna TaxID=35525 RepID=A0ABQ9ZHE7_9CRUS|nr:hypothetical protein OUZ56_021210 [Daphnia magna]
MQNNNFEHSRFLLQTMPCGGAGVAEVGLMPITTTRLLWTDISIMARRFGRIIKQYQDAIKRIAQLQRAEQDSSFETFFHKDEFFNYAPPPFSEEEGRRATAITTEMLVCMNSHFAPALRFLANPHGLLLDLDVYAFLLELKRQCEEDSHFLKNSG